MQSCRLKKNKIESYLATKTDNTLSIAIQRQSILLFSEDCLSFKIYDSSRQRSYIVISLLS